MVEQCQQGEKRTPERMLNERFTILHRSSVCFPIDSPGGRDFLQKFFEYVPNQRADQKAVVGVKESRTRTKLARVSPVQLESGEFVTEMLDVPELDDVTLGGNRELLAGWTENEFRDNLRIGMFEAS